MSVTSSVTTHSDFQTKLRVEYVLQERDGRLAAHIVEGVKHCMDMVEQLRPPVIEALIEYCEKNAKQFPAPRLPVIECFRRFGQHALKEAREHENRLYYGLTGRPNPDGPDE